jgi:hypothetical protein
MKIIVTHSSPDLDAITSVWLLKTYFPGWHDAQVEFVPAGQRMNSAGPAARQPHHSPTALTSAGPHAGAPRLASPAAISDPIEKSGDDEIIHVDTGLGPLDHHQTDDQNVSAAGLTWDYVAKNLEFKAQNEKKNYKKEAIGRIVKLIVEIDHFKEVFWTNPTADYHDLSMLGIIDGLKLQKPNQDSYYVLFGMQCLDTLVHHFENKIWAEEEIKNHGKTFQTQWGKGMGFETINDDVLQLAQKMGYVVVVRKDPRKGYVRIKARPRENGKAEVDFTPVYEVLKKKDPQATWFLHVSKKMLLNGTTKNPTMKPSTLSLDDIIEVLESV